MEETHDSPERGQSIVIIAIAVVVLLIFAVIAVDLAYGYVHRRGDQNAADAASLAGARELAQIRNENDGDLTGKFISDQAILESMNDFAERNGIEDTDGVSGNSVNTNVVGYYLDASGSRIQGADGEDIVVGELGIVHPDAQGIEAVTHSVAPSFFGGIVGLDGLPIQADAAVVFQGDVCDMMCIAPIATLTMTFEYAPHCYNIWDGSRQTSGGGGGANPCQGECLGDNTCSNSPSTVCHNNNQCDFGACENGFCRQNGSIACAPSGDVCSNSPTTSCNNDNQCDFGTCLYNSCTGNGGIFCSTNADCRGTCGPEPVAVCSVSGTPCDTDDDCPSGEFCEDYAGGSNSGLGWLNWSLQGNGHSCQDVGQPSDCSEGCLEYNLTPLTCLSGRISVGDWVAGASGVKNASEIRTLLQCYADLEPGRSDPVCTTPGAPVTVVIYDVWQGNGCNQGQNPGKLKYHVVGFAKFKILGYELAQGSGNAAGHNGAGCDDWGMEGNRITGEFLGWVDGTPGDCEPNGTIIAPKVIK